MGRQLKELASQKTCLILKSPRGRVNIDWDETLAIFFGQGFFYFMGKIIFILGGTRSGKSSFAVEMAKKTGKNKVVFIATCIPEDDEMKKRIEIHKKSRPVLWETLELKYKVQSTKLKVGEKNKKHENQIIKTLKNIRSDCKVAILDCLTLLISNLLINGFNEEMIEKEVENLASFLLKAPFASIVVSNEVGLGIVPENKLARQFRDIAGISTQIIAKYAEEVYFVAGGIPVEIK